MINEESVKRHHDSMVDPSFVRPDYEGYCFSNISATIEQVLTGSVQAPALPGNVLPKDTDQIQRVVVFFIDSFGWRFLEPYQAKIQSLRTLDAGIWSKLTAQFPSTTAAHVTNFHTGLTPSESGVFEWFYYDPQVGQVIAPLLFAQVSNATDGVVIRDSLRELNLEPDSILPRSDFYRRLEARGVRSHILGHHHYTPSTYGSAVMFGASHHRPFKSVKEGLGELMQLVQDSNQKELFYFYIDSFDATCHGAGPESEAALAEARSVFDMLDSAVWSNVKMGQGDTLFMIIADHGHEQIDPASTLYLDVLLPELLEATQRSPSGGLIAPCGSPRDLFLHIKEDCVERMYSTLSELLASKARVIYTEELHEGGYFGRGESTEVFKQKTGNIAVLPLAGESIWLSLGGRFKNHYRGHHGGLTRNEMEVAFWSGLGALK
jgi:predicted AlkP superfamily pyrophosphatase or phosphodiesterase